MRGAALLAGLAGLLLAAPLLSGCGGGDGAPSGAKPAGRGTATLKVAWPARDTRLVPNAANSIVVGLTQGTIHVERTIPRPAAGGTSTTATVTGLAYGDYAVDVKAYPATDGTGVPQATGTGAMTVTEDVPGSLSVGLGSTVAKLEISPANPAVLSNGGAARVAVTALDDQGRMVLLTAGGGSENVRLQRADTSLQPIQYDGPGSGATLVGGTLADIWRVGHTSVTASLRTTDGGATVTATFPVMVTPGPLALGPSDAKGIQTSSGSAFLQNALQTGRVRSNITGFTYYRWRANFPLPVIPSGVTVVSATFSADVDEATRVGRGAFVSAYNPATGTVNMAATTGNVSVGSFGVASGRRTVDATAVVKSRLAAGAPYVGFDVSSTGNLVTWSSPTLTIVYDPAP